MKEFTLCDSEWEAAKSTETVIYAELDFQSNCSTSLGEPSLELVYPNHSGLEMASSVQAPTEKRKPNPNYRGSLDRRNFNKKTFELIDFPDDQNNFKRNKLNFLETDFDSLNFSPLISVAEAFQIVKEEAKLKEASTHQTRTRSLIR